MCWASVTLLWEANKSHIANTCNVPYGIQHSHMAVIHRSFSTWCASKVNKWIWHTSSYMWLMSWKYVDWNVWKQMKQRFTYTDESLRVIQPVSLAVLLHFSLKSNMWARNLPIHSNNKCLFHINSLDTLLRTPVPLNKFRHANVAKMTCWSPSSIRMRKKGNLGNSR